MKCPPKLKLLKTLRDVVRTSEITLSKIQKNKRNTHGISNCQKSSTPQPVLSSPFTFGAPTGLGVYRLKCHRYIQESGLHLFFNYLLWFVIKWFWSKWTIPNYNNLFHSLIRNFSEGILRRVFDRIGWRDFGVLHRVDVEVARAAASFDGGHHAAEERKVPAVSWLDVVLAVSLLFDGKIVTLMSRRSGRNYPISHN